MEEEFSLSDFDLKFYLFFQDKNAVPIELNPRIGSFKIQKMQMIYENYQVKRTPFDVKVKEVDLSNDEDNPYFHYYDKSTRGIYSCDMS